MYADAHWPPSTLVSQYIPTPGQVPPHGGPASTPLVPELPLEPLEPFEPLLPLELPIEPLVELPLPALVPASATQTLPLHTGLAGLPQSASVSQVMFGTPAVHPIASSPAQMATPIR